MAEYEIKYCLPDTAVPMAGAYLRAACQPELGPEQGGVVSVYYDSPHWHCMQEKASSDYQKRKVRVRWYTDSTGTVKPGPAYLEVKSKRGSRRTKLRIETPWRAAEAARMPLHVSAWRWATDTLIKRGHLWASSMRPAIEIAYQRDRYISADRRARMCLDSQIRVGRTNHQVLPRERTDGIGWAVCEQKSDTDRLIPELQPVVQAGARRAAFSKYYLCIQQVMATHGSIHV